jgi:hypothetical protein
LPFFFFFSNVLGSAAGSTTGDAAAATTGDAAAALFEPRGRADAVGVDVALTLLALSRAATTRFFFDPASSPELGSTAADDGAGLERRPSMTIAQTY